MRFFRIILFVCLFALNNTYQWIAAQKIDDLEHRNITDIKKNILRSKFQFNGYTNYWHDIYREWIHYGNLYKTAIPTIESTILQSKVDVAEDVGVPGLYLQEGFFSGLLASAYATLDQPSAQLVEETFAKENVLVLVDPGSETGKRLSEKFTSPHAMVKEKLKSHQYNAKGFVEVNAFILENGDRKLFVISSTNQEMRNKLKELIDSTKELLQKYDLHKGWFGAKTLVKSVTCTPGHYLDVIAKGMNEGMDWFVFDGYMDFLSQKELDVWV
ncbi:MAG: hypothetical protein LBT43_01770, partial [Prevotella sp.]|nr:hypothetical protein [Prevotella sp.]